VIKTIIKEETCENTFKYITQIINLQKKLKTKKM